MLEFSIIYFHFNLVRRLILESWSEGMIYGSIYFNTVVNLIIEPQRDKTNKMTYAP